MMDLDIELQIEEITGELQPITRFIAWIAWMRRNGLHAARAIVGADYLFDLQLAAAAFAERLERADDRLVVKPEPGLFGRIFGIDVYLRDDVEPNYLEMLPAIDTEKTT